MNEQTEHYRVEVNTPGCETCGHSTYWTIVSGHGDDEVAVSQSWSDQELVEDIAQKMNSARKAALAENEQVRDALCRFVTAEKAWITAREPSKHIFDDPLGTAYLNACKVLGVEP